MTDIRTLSDAELEALAGGGDDYSGFVTAAAQRVGVRPELALRVMKQESGGRASAVSPKGARGPFQLMPGTASDLGADIDDPHQNIEGGLRYLKQQLDDFGDERLALAAYNAGPEAVRKHKGIPPFPETQNYVASILGEAGAEPPAADIAQASDAELEAIAAGQGGPAGLDLKPADLKAEFEFTAPGASGLRPSKIVDAQEGQAATPAQEAFYVGEIEAGRLDPEKVRGGGYRAGSEEFPLLQRDPKDLPKPGDWYVTPDGQKKQVPAESWAPTIANAIGMVAGMEGAIPDDARFAAMKRAAQSGALLGGRNELVAGLDSLPALFEGGVPMLAQRFGETLRREDTASAQARRDFPLAYDASATGGALATGVVLPGGGASLLGRAATGAGIGAASGFLATDGDVGDRGIGAGIGAVGGAALPFVLPKVVSGAADMVGIPRKVGPEMWAEAEGQLTRMGTKLNELSPDARAFLGEQLERGVKPSDAAVMALNRGLPRDVPLTRGDITGLPGDQFAFNAALRGGRGEGAAVEAQGLAASRQDALRDVPLRIAGDMAGGARGPVPGEGGVAVSDALGAMRDSAKRGVDAAYDAARASDGASVLPSYDAQRLSVMMSDAVRDFDPERIRFVAGENARLDAVSGGDVGLRQLFDMRSRLTNLRASSDAVEGAAAGKAVATFDKFIDDAMTADLFTGDPAAVGKWKDAIKANREFAETFKQGDLIARLTEKAGTGGARRLTVDPGEAANYIFGRSALGAVGKQNLYRDLVKMRDLLGEGSDPWNQLRAEAFLRIARSGEGGVEGGVQQFSGANFLKAWNKAKGEDERLINLLFKPEEKATINQFAALSARVTSPVKGGDNPSNTAIAGQLLRKMTGFGFAVGKATPFIHQAFEVLEQAAGASAARKAMKPIPRKTPVPMRQIPGATAGYGSAELTTPRE